MAGCSEAGSRPRPRFDVGGDDEPSPYSLTIRRHQIAALSHHCRHETQWQRARVGVGARAVETLYSILHRTNSKHEFTFTFSMRRLTHPASPHSNIGLPRGGSPYMPGLSSLVNSPQLTCLYCSDRGRTGVAPVSAHLLDALGQRDGLCHYAAPYNRLMQLIHSHISATIHHMRPVASPCAQPSTISQSHSPSSHQMSPL
mgnify:CR=1 FL=1